MAIASRLRGMDTEDEGAVYLDAQKLDRERNGCSNKRSGLGTNFPDWGSGERGDRRYVGADRLRFIRSRIGATYDATVTDEGRIRLESDGEEFRSPSRAAMVAAGMPGRWSINGGCWTPFARNCSTGRFPRRRPRSTGRTRTWSVSVSMRACERRGVIPMSATPSASPSVNFWRLGSQGPRRPRSVGRTRDGGRAKTDNLPVPEDDEGGDDLNVRLTVGNLSPPDGVESISPLVICAVQWPGDRSSGGGRAL